MADTSEDKLTMTPEQKKAFTPVLIGLFIFGLVTGANTALSSAYVLFADKFGVATTQVVIANSCLTGMAFILNQFTGKFLVKYGARKSMMVAFAGITVGFIICAFAPNVYVVWLGYACIATIQSFGQANGYATVIRNWIAPKYQGRYMGYVSGVAVLGSAIWPVLGSWMFTTLGLSTGFLVLIPCYLIPAAIAIFLLIKDKPEDCGVEVIGLSEEDESARPEGERGQASRDSSFNVLTSKTFWVCAVALILTTVLHTSLNLMTTSLQMAGMDATSASVVTSVAGLIAFPVNIVAGHLVDKRGIRSFTVVFYGLVAVSAFFMFVFFSTGSSIALWLFVLANALCRPYINVMIYMSSAIFKENATLVQPRMSSVVGLAGMIITPIISALADMWGGYTYVTFIWMACAVLAIFAWFAAIKTGEKEFASDEAAA